MAGSGVGGERKGWVKRRSCEWGGVLGGGEECWMGRMSVG